MALGGLSQVFDMLHTGKQMLDRVQGRVDEGFKQIGAIAKGALVEDVEVKSASGAKVTHGLGTVPTGAVVVRQSAPASVYMTSASGKNLAMASDNDVTVSLWVF